MTNKTFMQSRPHQHYTQLLIKNKQKSQDKNDILCKLNFQIDQYNQQINIYQNHTLENITKILISKLNQRANKQNDDIFINQEDKQGIKMIIKNRLQDIMINNQEKTLQAVKWRNKLKSIIQNKQKSLSEQFHNIKENDSQQKHSKITYFGYNRSLNPNSSSQSHLYNKPILNQQLSQCTFHPHHTQSIHNTSSSKSTLKTKHDVFNRLYSQAIIKGQKMKQRSIKSALQQQQDYKRYKFIPTINQCSKKIIKIKKQLEMNNIDYQEYSSLFLKKQDKYKQNQKKQNNKNFFNNSQQSNNMSYKRLPLQQKSINKLNISKSKSKQKLNKNYIKNMKKVKNDQQKSVINMNNSSNSNSLRLNTQSSTIRSNNIIKYHQKDKNLSKIKEYQSHFNIKENKQIISNKTQNSLKQIYNKPKLKTEHYALQESKTYQLLNTSFDKYKNDDSSKIDSFQNTKQKKNKQRLNPLQFFKQQEAMTTTKVKSKDNQQNSYLYQKSIKEQQIKVDDRVQQQKFITKDRINQSFSWIFDFLSQSSNQYNEISHQSITDNKLIPLNIQKIIYPMAIQMKQLGVGLDRQEFIWSMGRIFQSLSDNQKKDIWIWSLKIASN